MCVCVCVCVGVGGCVCLSVEGFMYVLPGLEEKIKKRISKLCKTKNNDNNEKNNNNISISKCDMDKNGDSYDDSSDEGDEGKDTEFVTKSMYEGECESHRKTTLLLALSEQSVSVCMGM